jgi:hypothetical protein
VIYDPAREQKGIGLYPSLRLLLQHNRSCSNSIAVAHVAHPQLHQIAGAQFAVDAQVE